MSISIASALHLSDNEAASLIQGRSIGAISKAYIYPGQNFGLCSPDDELDPKKVSIRAWAKCSACQPISRSDSLGALSRLVAIPIKELQELFQEKQYVFLIYLRVYSLVEPVEGSVSAKGQFVKLLTSLSINEYTPVFNDRIFARRKQQLENLESPLHPELEELHNIVSQLVFVEPTAKRLSEEISLFLGWKTFISSKAKNSDSTWIENISDLGKRSKESDQGKTNYQAGTDFENIVRTSLQFLGFTIDYSHKGGAGGLDLFCSKPYPLVGECKSGKKIPNDTAVQLLNLGTLRLKDEVQFRRATKLIIGPGELTEQLKDAARVHSMTIINPETLEKLVKLQNNHYGSVDLFKLKDYLKPGQSNDEVEKYIDKVLREISVRSLLVQLTKKYLEDTSSDSIGVETLMGLYFSATPPLPLQPKEMHEILIELSSPLIGHLGRSKGLDWQTDRFYFLRDLIVD
ncbi:DUF1802 family protein [Leptolyngbya sp. FACHB-321]|uniref:DUF1802 family protein n=1 Tax=Leptolyngbya sp. FACHB-321 TaxID=2692807 RepID=UPI00168A283C|nr:DUF1802 family protein [Leptolyngbya sp. FACHB-321]MBD2038462.1 DUF1802 family protein [Leptolyngbya sp. FACHB-321]